jgi:septal ring factor EnvC (AmiA/AmiB activator)
MTKRQQIDARVEAQLASLRAALDVQFKRIAQMQAELDVLPQARQRRNTLRELLTSASHNGNGHGVLRQGRVRHAVPKM